MNDFLRLRIRLWGLLTVLGFVAAIGSVMGFFGKYAWWMDLGAHFRVQYAVLFSILAVCYFVGKRKTLACGFILLSLLNVIPVALFLLPPAAAPGNHGTLVRALLINVDTQNGSPEQVMSLIKTENPDVVILEEIDERWVKALAPLFTQYPAQIIQTGDDNFGIGLLSRMTTLSTKIVYIGEAGVPSVIAEIALDDRKVTLLATHPLPPAGRKYSAYRNEQLEKVAETVRQVEGPVLLLGDLNVSPWSYYYRRFINASGLRNSSEGRGIFPTWPTFFPLMLIPIDHCLHTEDIVIVSKRIGRNVGSDHYPVIVDFALDTQKEGLD